MISTVVRQKNNPQSTQVLKRIRQCCYLSGFLMVRKNNLNFFMPTWSILSLFRFPCFYLTWYLMASIGPSTKCLAPTILARRGTGWKTFWPIFSLHSGCYPWSYSVESWRHSGFKFVFHQVIQHSIKWFFCIQDIAESSFRGRPQPFRSTSQFIADNLFSFLIQLLFLVQVGNLKISHYKNL